MSTEGGAVLKLTTARRGLVIECTRCAPRHPTRWLAMHDRPGSVAACIEAAMVHDEAAHGPKPRGNRADSIEAAR